MVVVVCFVQRWMCVFPPFFFLKVAGWLTWFRGAEVYTAEGPAMYFAEEAGCSLLRGQGVLCKKMAHSSVSASRKRAVVGARVYFGEWW